MTIGRGAFGLACFCLLALAAIVGPAIAAAAECPNEEFRRGPSALLPECRAYELVSPPDKEGGYVIPTMPVRVSPDGNAAGFFSFASFAGNGGAPWDSSYVARRGAASWGTQGLDAPQFNSTGNLNGHPSPVSSLYFTKTLQASKVALLPGAIENGSNIYVQNNLTGQRELVAAREGDALFNEAGGGGGQGLYVGSSRDWSHLLLTSTSDLSGEVTDGPPHFYDFTGGRPHVVDILPNGKIAPAAHLPNFTVGYAHAMSEDGSRAFFMVGKNGVGPLYMREDNSRTVPISASQRSEDAGTVYPAEFIAASPNGSEVIFTVVQHLTEEEDGSIYRYDVDSGELTGLLPSAANLRKVLAVSEDGSYVYFASTSVLAEGATPPSGGSVNLYALHDGQIKWIGQTAASQPESLGPNQVQASPDGNHFAFASFSPMTEGDLPNPACTGSPVAGACMQVYAYEYASGKLTCVSCSDPNLGNSELGGLQVHEHPYGDRYPRAVLDNGTVFFDTPNHLLPRDVNGSDDVYAWRNGAHSLISTGTGSGEAGFAAATADGSSVFFRTAQSLVKQDVDTSPDLYVDRIGGGLA
jgi:hypothetical protein